MGNIQLKKVALLARRENGISPGFHEQQGVINTYYKKALHTIKALLGWSK